MAGQLGSPGRWRAKDREPPTELAEERLKGARAGLIEDVENKTGRKDMTLNFILRLAPGRF